jgi:hypothetical protein
MKKAINVKTTTNKVATTMVVAISVIAIGFLVFIFIFGLLNRGCGDGICQISEQRNGRCPKDCARVVATKKSVTVVAKPAFKIKKITILKNYGKDVDWSAQLDKIITPKIGDDGYYDVMVMNSDGSNEQCLTCDKTDIPQNI